MAFFKYDGSLASETIAPVDNLFGSLPIETLTGGSSPTGLWGDQGRTLIGNSASDTFFIKSPLDKVIEHQVGGTDKIVAWSNVSLTKFANIENLEVDGDKTYGAGNSTDNIVQGGAGSQQLYGGGGQDVLIGGAGADTFIIVKGQGNDVIQDFTPSDGDVVRLTAGYTSFSQVQSHLSQVGADVKLDLGGGDATIFRNLNVSQLSASNFALQLDTSKIGAETFHDDFNGPLSLWDAQSNPGGAWRPDFGYQGSQGVGSYSLVSNGEQEIYTSPYFRDHNGDFSVNPFTSNADGTLSITAAPSTNSELFGYKYTSGMISTAPSFAQTYGYFEMRAELPTTAGAWPAFWLIPADGSWPPELDVMETLTGDPNTDYTTQHSGLGGSNTAIGAANFIPDSAGGYHTYGVLWTHSTLTWYVDGVQVFQTATPADMNKPMYMIANEALGGWSGTIDDAHMPATMKIDYIHAYALADGSSTTADSATAGLAATHVIAAGETDINADTALATGNASVVEGATVSHASPADAGASAPMAASASSPVVTSGASLPPVAAVTGASAGQSSPGQVATSSDQNTTLIAPAGQAASNLVGGAGNDTITGGGGANYLRGGAGDDIIAGGSGFNDINGNQGNDTVHGGGGDNWVVGGQGNDLLYGGGGTNLVLGNLGDDTLHAGAGDDVVRGGKGDDVIFGGPGRNFLSGDLGHNTETGGTGADTFHSFGAVGVDLVTNFDQAKGDQVMLDPGTAYTVAQVGSDTVVSMTGGGEVILQNISLGTLHPGWIVD